jgi:hypothetical protein
MKRLTNGRVVKLRQTEKVEKGRRGNAKSEGGSKVVCVAAGATGNIAQRDENIENVRLGNEQSR